VSSGGIPSTKELIRALRDQAWRVETTSQGHYKGFAPDGRTLITFCETSEPRAMKNNLSDLRRTGQFQWPPPHRRANENDGARGGDVGTIESIPKVVQPKQPPERDLDALFRNLKDAKAEFTAAESRHSVVMDAVRQAEAALEEAKRRAERALAEANARARSSQEDLDLAKRLVMEAKAEFDAAFEGNAA
jgi:hypothetical protein